MHPNTNYYTNYKQLHIYLHPEVIIIIIATIGVGAQAAGRCSGGAWLRLRRGGVIVEEEVVTALGHQLLLGGVELVHRWLL
jgi:hypothetical protein